MNLIIFGARGLLGQELSRQLARFEPIRLDAAECDITEADQVAEAVGRYRPQVIINAAAFTDVDAAEKRLNKKNWRVNAEGVRNIAQTARDAGTLLIHYSTDYVFGGDRLALYSEDDRPCPVNEYGRAKAEGETLLMETMRPAGRNPRLGPFYLIRTSWLFGPHGRNFLENILEKAGQQSELRVVNDQFGKPTYARDLARATDELLCQQAPSGVYHITNDGVTTWHGLARYAVQRWHDLHLAAKKSPPYLMPRITPVASRELAEEVCRPQTSALRSTKMHSLRPWPAAVDEYLKERLNRS